MLDLSCENWLYYSQSKEPRASARGIQGLFFMKTNWYKVLLGTGVLILGLTSNLSADWREFVWTYDYQTMHKGTAEIEYYVTLELPDKTESEINRSAYSG